MPEFENALIISDLHLTPAYPYTAERFIEFCQNEAKQVQALFIIGDLFEFWVGDDAHLHHPFHQNIAEQINTLKRTGVKVFFIDGNRDFMLGEAFAKKSGWEKLPDPSVVQIASQRWLLSHGDMLCTADPAYQMFRKFTRVKLFQKIFLLIPTAFREKLGNLLRKRATMKYQKRERFDPTTANIKGNVTLEACAAITQQNHCDQLIHGHTHRPGVHNEKLGQHAWRRWVLSDWDLDHPEMKPRANALFINKDSLQTIDLMKV
jgi:UDP-2,3-diacylglucosamine hydrolase